MGYDAVFFNNGNDCLLINRALKENRIILTRDTRIADRKLAKDGALKVVLLSGDMPLEQLKQLILNLNLDPDYNPFSLCLVCNHPIVEQPPDAIQERVPPFVFKTQRVFRECPVCRRVYWRGTHWLAMKRHLAKCLEMKN